MTFSKLSLRNARRQAKDYLVYFVSVVMAAALLYSFNALTFSQEIKTLAEGMNMLPLMIAMATVVVVCVFGWLVAYATKFMLLRRGRELGTYLLIGLENKQVARLFFLENLAVGGCALALGIVLGGLLYQIFRAIVLALFKLPYHFTFGFSLPALALTVVCFVLIYLHALRRSWKYIRKAKIHDLIYSDRVNEGIVIQTGRMRRWMFGVSIVLAAAETCLLMVSYAMAAAAGAGCLILFLFAFFLSFASGVPAFFDKRPTRKYQGQNLLIFRTLTAKLATMGMLMATILTIQQLSETERYKRQFQLLQKLGMDRREMAKALGHQFAIYYALPAVPPVLIGVPFILHLAHAPEPGVMVGMSSPGIIVAISLGIFFLIYAIYILLAYTSLKRDVLPGYIV